MKKESFNIDSSVEEIHSYCRAHCNKCEVDALVEQQRVECQVCFSPLVYFCLMCHKQFANPTLITNHVINQLKQASKLTKCTKCYRSNFSTQCSLIEHESKCNSPFLFDSEVLVNLERCDNQSKKFEDYSLSDVFDDVEIGEEFKPPLTIITHSTSVFQNQNSADLEAVKLESALKVNENQRLDNVKNASREKTLVMHSKIYGQQKTTEKDDLGNKCSKCKKSLLSKSSRWRHSKTCGRSEDSIRSLGFLYCCDHCDYKTIYKDNLARHIHTKHFDLNKCSECKKSFSFATGLQRHSKICGQPKNSMLMLSCDQCSYKTMLKPTLYRHIRYKHLPRDPNANKCVKCKKSLSSRSHLTRHLKICGQSEDFIRSLKRFSCDHCNLKTIYKHHLARHIHTKHLSRNPDLKKCSKCKKTFLCPTYLRKHSKICGQSEDLIRSLKFSCDHCNYETVVKSRLAVHMKVKHLPRDPHANKCLKCDKSYSVRSNLTKHSKICGKSKDFLRTLMLTCDHCNYKTIHKNSLVDHIRAKHLPRDPNANNCSKCKKSFSSLKYLRKHSKTCGQPARNIIPSSMFFCDYCIYETHYKTNLVRHIKSKHLPQDPNANKSSKSERKFFWRKHLSTHSKTCGQSKSEGRYSCDHCNFRTHFKINFEIHIQIKHLPCDPNANKCKKCKKSFGHPAYLRRHIARTCGKSKTAMNLLKRYTCYHCEYKSYHKHSLADHIQRKHLPRDPKKFKCKKCERYFYLRSTFNNHSKICGK